MKRKLWFAWLLLAASFGGYAEGLHQPRPNRTIGAVSHYNIIDTSERPDEHVSEKMHEIVVKI